MKLTRCPHCETLFEVSLNELQTAEGAVRCGQCLRIFNATYHLNSQSMAHESDHMEPSIADSSTASRMMEPPVSRTDTHITDSHITDPFESSGASTRAHHNTPIPTITERLNADALDDETARYRKSTEDHHTDENKHRLSPEPPLLAMTGTDDIAVSMAATAPREFAPEEMFTSSSQTTESATRKTPLRETATTRPHTDEALDFETLLGLKPGKEHVSEESSFQESSSRKTASSTQTDDLEALLKLAPEPEPIMTETASSAQASSAQAPSMSSTSSAMVDNYDDSQEYEDYDALAESWSDWVRQQWQWIGAAIILMLAGAIGVLFMTPGQSSGLSNYRIESTQVQTASIQSRLNIRFELRNLTDQPMSLEGIEIRLKNLTDSILSEHHLSRGQLQGDLDPIPPFSTRTLEVEVPRPGTLVASVEIIPLEND